MKPREAIISALSIQPMKKIELLVECGYQGTDQQFDRLLANLESNQVIRLMSDNKYRVYDDQKQGLNKQEAIKFLSGLSQALRGTADDIDKVIVFIEGAVSG